jgi:hypothetical protein
MFTISHLTRCPGRIKFLRKTKTIMKTRTPNDPTTEDLSVELLIKLTDREVNLFRLAMSKAAGVNPEKDLPLSPSEMDTAEEESKQATKMLFKTLKQRQCRYTVRELGGSYNAAL